MTTQGLLDLSTLAGTLSRNERARVLSEIPETEFHGYLASVLSAMEPNALVEVTHGAQELGKDVVMIKSDALKTHVYAFVVKRGDIRARTAGDVDEIVNAVEMANPKRGNRATQEIVSQIRQAKAHPATVTSMMRTLKVDDVYVVVVGDISNNVRTRLLGEVVGAAEVWDMTYIIDQFTKYYPQVFFDGRAIDFLNRPGIRGDCFT